VNGSGHTIHFLILVEYFLNERKILVFKNMIERDGLSGCRFGMVRYENHLDIPGK